MKNVKILLALFAFCLSSLTMMAGPVSYRTARTVATNFWNTYRPADVKPVTESDMVSMTYDEINHMHVFAVGQEGFVIVAGDDRVEPVLAYSFDSPFPKELHPALRYWLGGYESQLVEVAGSDAEGSVEATTSWNKLLSAKDTTATDTVQLLNVPAMVTTRWDQGSPYNRYCPYDTNRHARTVVGCVATAMAQIIRYWGHPSCGTGEHSYVPEPRNYEGESGSFYYTYDTQSVDYAHTTYVYEYMPTFIESSFSMEREIKAVATLSYHCGVSVDMKYGTSSSGAYSDNVPNALVQYFKYKPSLQRAYRDHVGNDSVWKTMIDADIYAGRPIYYSGHDSVGGHAFILDGADDQGRYHFNFGWSGSGDGYYYFYNIAIGSGGVGGNATYTFNWTQSAVFGIEPIETHLDTVDYYDTVCNEVSTYHFYDYDIPAQNGEYYFVHLDTVYRVHLNKAQRRYMYLNPNGGSGSIVTQRYCYLNGAVLPQCSFRRDGYNFVGWCSSPDGDDEIYNAGDTLWVRRNLNLYAIWQDTAGVGIDDFQISSLDSQLLIWPNPTSGELFVTIGGSQQAELSVLDVMGRTVLRETVCGKAKISLQALSAGAYTVQVKTADCVCNRRVIKR